MNNLTRKEFLVVSVAGIASFAFTHSFLGWFFSDSLDTTVAVTYDMSGYGMGRF